METIIEAIPQVKEKTTITDLQHFLRIMTGNSKYFSPLAKLMTAGNHKLPTTTGIFNMGSANDCPSYALGFCQAIVDGKHICYAKKSENSSRPNVYPHRKKQEKYWKSVDAEKFVVDFITMNSLKRLPFNALRLNESGDFWGQDCVDKAERIARMLKRHGVTCYCYSSRRDLDFSKCKRLIVSGFGFMKEGIKNEFKMIRELKDRPKGYGICKGNCRVCNRCMVGGRKTVIVNH